MLVAINKLGEQINACKASKKESYVCPYCGTELILKSGHKVISHFAHKVNVHRKCSKGETEKHYDVKYYIANQLKFSGYHVEIEPFCPEIMQFPDILVNSNFVIEVQFSRISFQEILERTNGFKKLNMKVMWIIEDSNYHKGVLYLNTFQSYFINPHTRVLFTWNHRKRCIVKYHHIQHLEGKKFLAKRLMVNIDNIMCDDITISPYTYKLKKQSVMNYIQTCRRKNSVLEPSLSAMYQLRLTDELAWESTGYICPNQLYIENHPVQWQLELQLLQQQAQNINLKLKDILKFRRFYLNDYSKTKIIDELIDQYLSVNNSS